MILDVLLITEDGFVLTTEDGLDLFVDSIEVADEQQAYHGGGGRWTNEDELIESVWELAELRAKNAREAVEIAAVTIGKAAEKPQAPTIGKIEIQSDQAIDPAIELQAAKVKRQREEEAFILSMLMLFED